MYADPGLKSRSDAHMMSDTFLITPGGLSASSLAISEDSPPVQDVAPQPQPASSLPVPWSWLIPLLEKLNYPVLDSRFASCAPVTCFGFTTTDPMEVDVILHKMRLCSDAGIRTMVCTIERSPSESCWHNRTIRYIL